MTTEDLGILVSRTDDVSERIGERLLDLVDWEEAVDDSRPAAEGGGTVYRRPGVELRTIETRHLDAEGVAAAFEDPGLIAVASRHAGETGPLLTAHHTGNFGPADHGGDGGTLARAAPNAHAAVVDAFDEHAPDGYDVGIECTHHGPSDVGAPSLFVEVGSGPEQWTDEEAVRAAARAILDLTDVTADAPTEDGTGRHLVGFGGGHYAPRFERIVRETDWAVGHVAADWALDAMGDPEDSRDVLEAAFAESAAEYALVATDDPALVSVIEDLGYRVVSETWVRETSDVALPLVESLEAAICPVDAGLRFGRPARDETASVGEYRIGAIDEELLSAANAVDPEAVLAAVDRVAVGYDTDNGGTRAAATVALEGVDAEDELLDALVSVLSDGYDAVERGAGEIRARRHEFDPALAREAGVSPGPDFGRLAEGESVVVGGDRVEPDDVHVQREETFSTSVLPD